MKNKKYLLFLLLIPIIIIIGRSFALPSDGEVKTIELNSDNYDNVGSFNIKKSVDWIESGKAEVTYTVKTIEKKNKNSYKDVVLVIDTSSSMNEGKLDKAKNDSQELIRSLLNDLNNRVALITFNNNATIKSNFTNNKEELETLLSSLNISNKANFNNALLKVNELLNNYDNLDNHELIVLFLTDGNPNEGMPNDKATYGMLKDKYQDMVINGIQYEKEKAITDGIKNISDNQFIVSEGNILDEAILTSVSYERFNIVDIINNEHFNISSIDDIKVNNGNVELTNENGNQKINWNLSGIKSGVTGTMIVTINLNSNLINQSGLYIVNNTTTINSKLEGESEKTLTSDKTLVLKNKYNVTYDLNKPGSCDLDSIPSESHFVGDSVEKKSQSLYCDGYYIKTWAIKDTENVIYINSDTFIMPSHNVTINAVWAKNGIEKSVDGVVLAKSNTLYRVLQDAAIDGTYAREYTGPHMDSNTQPGTQNIYHWYAASDENEKGTEITNMYNVQFANHCWRMIRTTDTGGVRLLYNGEYDEQKKCGSGRTHKNYSTYSYTSMSLEYSDRVYSYSYYFADSYTYNRSTNKYVLTDPVQMEINGNNYGDFVGKYTCYYNGATECSTIYKITGTYADNYSKGVQLIYQYSLTDSYTTDTYYASEISSYAPFNNYASGLAASGYMYGDNYRINSVTYNDSLTFSDTQTLVYKVNIGTSIWVADEVTVTSSGSYQLKNAIHVSNPIPLNRYVGKYICEEDYLSWCSSYDIHYVAAAGRNYVIYRYNYITDKTYATFGASVVKNEDETYTLQDTIQVSLEDYVSSATPYVGMYVCENSIDTTCAKPRRIYSTSNYNNCWWCDSPYQTYYYAYIGGEQEIVVAKNANGNELIDTLVVDKQLFTEHPENYSDYIYTCGNMETVCDDNGVIYISKIDSSSHRINGVKQHHYYGTDVTWDGEKYTLVNPIGLDIFKDTSQFSNHHFFCVNENTLSCEEVGYIISISSYSSVSLSYILFTDGNKDILAVRDSMVKNNKNDSLVKTIIDDWYQVNMAKYTDYLEDSVYCNNRKPLNEDTSWTRIDGNVFNSYATNDDFNSYERYTQGYENNYGDYKLSLKCEWETDRFSMDNPKAKLKYPVALLTYNEMALLNNTNARKLAISTYSLSTTGSGSNIILVSDGRSYTSGSYPTSPAITLKEGTEYISGDGSPNNPYVVDTSEVDG